MNYGKFFRLNRSLSKIEEGIAIYDYIDLPAYFTPSVENYLSPKYPISVNISQSSVSFRLHYCAYKIEGPKGDFKNYTYYTYNRNDFVIENQDRYKSGDDIKVAHMEEVILELPFIENATSVLSDIIKDIYITNFPQMIGGSTSTGGRFLEQLIHKRYPKSSEWKSVGELEKDGDTEALLYGTLREASDDSPSYSTLCLMDLIKDVEGVKDKKRIDLYNEKDGSVVAFLRKLLLDFMFDLKHSDVFQNSSYYQQMYSGLMSDFYFSALMHKCEYYYYRKLIRNIIDKNKENIESVKERIAILYAEELSRAEDLWVTDIMYPLAEEHFVYNYRGDDKYKRELFERYHFISWNSWFAEPEEEMKRVCFTMNEPTENKKDIDDKRIHICNTILIAELLGLRRSESESNNLVNNIIDKSFKNQRQISQWFLKRYDFNDVFHLHFYKHFNLLLFSVLFLAAFLLFFIDIGIIIGLALFILGADAFIRTFRTRGCTSRSPLISKRRIVMRKSIRRNGVITFILLLLLLIGLGLENNWKSIVECQYLKPISTAIIILLIPWILTFSIYEWPSMLKKWPSMLEGKLQHVMSYLHLLLPRLVASIAAAWLTLSMGFDLYISFFDSRPSLGTIGFLIIILLLFIMYEVNKVTPYSNSWLKLYRSLELMVISYTISLIIGLFVINFVGEKYMERGGFVGDGEFYTQYIDNSKRILYEGKKENSNKEDNKITLATINDSISYIISQIDGIMNKLDEQKIFRKEIEKLDSIYHASGSAFCSYPLVEHFDFFGKDVFVLRDFLIMFSFIAMFIGIFIQLIIFGDNKQMTEL